MLIVAIPKSASTSLMMTLSKLHDLKAEQEWIHKKSPFPAEANHLHKVHVDVRNLNQKVFDKFCGTSQFYKQHIFPSAENLSRLENKRIVVLLRPTDEILEAYHRGAQKKVHKLIPGFSHDMSLEAWMKRADELGLKQDLEMFNRVWRSKEGEENVLIIEYGELTNSPTQVIRRIEQFWGLKSNEKKVTLAKERYSRYGPVSHKIYVAKLGIRNVISRTLKSLGLFELAKKLLGRK